MTQKKAKIEPVHIEEAEKLRRIFDGRPHPRLSQAKFGDQYEIGSQGVVWQYLNARIPLNVEQAVRFARGLNCSVADFSPRLAAELAELTDGRDADHAHDKNDTPAATHIQPATNTSTEERALIALTPSEHALLEAARPLPEADKMLLAQIAQRLTTAGPPPPMESRDFLPPVPSRKKDKA